MKTTSSFLCSLLISASVAWFSAGCSRTETEATPQGTCRIEKYVAVSKSQFFDENNQTIYEYDAQGNLAKMLATSDKRPSSGATGAQTGTKAITYAYNADGYVTASASDELYLTTLDKTTREQITTTQSFAYETGRLSTRTTKRIGAYGITTIITELFAYTNSGELTTKTVTSTSVVHDPAIAKEKPTGSGESRQIWTYQNNVLTDYVQKSATSEYRPIMIQNGLVTKLTIPGDQGDYVGVYTYDNQGRPVKTEESVGGTPANLYTQTYSDAKPAEATLPLFKGWPVATQEYGKAGILRTKTDSYQNTVSGKMQVFSEQSSATQTNGQGLVTSNVITAKHPNSASQDYTTTETYTYSGCP